MTIGENRVRIKFNPGGDTLVDQIKQKSAELIDLCTTIPKPEDEKARAEVSRLIALAMTHYEDAAMWAVKAATADKP
jgi:hypothetical protein